MIQSQQANQQTLFIQRNNEAVSLIQRGEYSQASSQLMEAIQDFRSDMARYVALQEAAGWKNESNYESLSLDQWMVPSTEALHTCPSAAATGSFFIYSKGILIPSNFLQENQQRYCHVDVSAAIASVIFFNQGLACHLSHIRSSTDSHLLQKAIQLYRLSIQGMRHMQLGMSLQVNTVTNVNFLIAAMNNLAVSEHLFRISSSTNGQGENQYFETMRRILLNWRPRNTNSNSPDEVLWSCYVDNVLLGYGVAQASYCAGSA